MGLAACPDPLPSRCHPDMLPWHTHCCPPPLGAWGTAGFVQSMVGGPLAVMTARVMQGGQPQAGGLCNCTVGSRTWHGLI